MCCNVNGLYPLKKVQDYYFKKAKKDKYPARSVYKLEEAQQKYTILKKGDAVLDLGCSPGSWAMYAAKIVGPKGMVVGVDLLDTKKMGLANAADIHLIRADIMAENIIRIIQEKRNHFNVVLSDIAPRTTGNKWADQQKSLTLSRRTLELSEELLSRNGNFYCKVFEGEDFKEFVNQVKERFKSVKIFKPKSSRSESREVFVLGMRFVRK